MQQLIGGAIPIIPLLTIAPLADLFGDTTVMTVLGLVIVLVGVLSVHLDRSHRASGVAWSVVVKGAARVMSEVRDLFDATALPLFPWDVAPKHRFVRLEPAEVTGRRFSVAERAHWHVDADSRRAAEE